MSNIAQLRSYPRRPTGTQLICLGQNLWGIRLLPRDAQKIKSALQSGLSEFQKVWASMCYRYIVPPTASYSDIRQMLVWSGEKHYHREN